MADRDSIGEIGLDLVVNQNQFKRQMNSMMGLAKKAGAALASAFAVGKLVEFGKKCLELGSDLAEVQNVVDVTFPTLSAQVDQFAKSAAASFGLSETMAKQYTGTFGAMAKAFGFTEKQALDMGTTLTGLAGDVASFYNLSQDEAYAKLKSVFTGETESLKDLGVVMSQTSLDAYALANGFGKTTDKMSEAEKVALRYSFVQNQLSAAQGDFARTSDSWANQCKVLSLQMQSLMATVGQGLINLFTPVLRVINAVVGRLSVLASAFKSFTELITGQKSSGTTDNMQQTAAGMDDAAESAENLKNNTESAGDAATKASKKLKSLMGFDKINRLDSKDDSSSTSKKSDTGSTGNSVPDINGGIDFGSLAKGDTVADQLDKKLVSLFQNISQLAEPAISALKRLWNEGLSQLGNFTWQALKDFFHDFLVPVGSWVLGKGIPDFIDALNNGLMSIDYSKINDALKDLWKALTPFAINVGEGLLWFWKNVLVPLGTWTANEVLPRFLKTLSEVIKTLNSILEALQPLFQWFWDNVLTPIVSWTAGAFLDIWDSINDTLSKFSDWCSKNPETIQNATVIVGSFFAVWETMKLMSFIQQSGGVVAAFGRIKKATLEAVAAKLLDKAETIYLTALYAKDFVVGLAQTIAGLVKQAASFAAATAAKVADTAAQVALTAATALWNATCTLATAATTALGVAVNFLTSPIGLVVLAIGGLVAAGVLLYKNWDTVSAKAKSLWVSVKKSFNQNKFHHLFYYRSLAVATDDVVITGIQVTEEFTETETEKKQTVLYGQEGYVLKISGNKFIQQGAAGTVAKYLGEKLIGLRFRPMSGQFLDNPTIEAGDLTYVSDRKLRVYNCLVTNLTYTVGGSISVSCDAATPGKNSADRYSELTQNAVDLRKNTEEKLGEYDKSVKMLTALITQSFGVYQTEEKQGDGSSILYLHDKSTINESKTIWKMTSDAFAVSTDGGKTWNAGIDSSGNAVVNALSAVGIRWDWASGGTLTLGGKGNNKGRLEVLDDNDKLMTVLDEKGIQHYDGSESVPYHYRTESVEISFLEEEFEGGGTKTCVVHVDQPISSLFSKEFLDYYVTYGSKSVQATATINEIISPAAPSDSVMYVLGTFGVRSPKIYRDDTNTPCLKMDVECSYISCAFNNLKPRYTKPLKVTLTVNIVY